MNNHSLPSHASVVVIGGGVMGCSTLYHLAKHGLSDAILLERNKLTSGTTWHSAAQVRALRSTRNLTDLIRYSIDLYANLEVETGQSVGWINKGSLSIVLVGGLAAPPLRKHKGFGPSAMCALSSRESTVLPQVRDRSAHRLADRSLVPRGDLAVE